MDPGENSDSDSDMGVDETSDTPMGVNNTQDSSVERTGRGAVQCKRITKMREGELLNVQYNEDGQRIGEGGKDLASYSDEVRDLLWDAIKAKFNLTEDEKKGVVSDIGEKCKEFKSRLTRYYITPYKDQPEKLLKPPKKHEKNIRQEDWERFVKSRLTPKFQDSGKVINMSYLETLFGTIKAITGSSKRRWLSHPLRVGLTISQASSPHPTLPRKWCRVGVGKLEAVARLSLACSLAIGERKQPDIYKSSLQEPMSIKEKPIVETGEFDFDGEEEFGLEFDEEYEVGVSSVSHKSSELPLECLSVSGLGVGDCGLGWLWRSCTKLKRLELRSCEGIGDVNTMNVVNIGPNNMAITVRTNPPQMSSTSGIFAHLNSGIPFDSLGFCANLGC
ncbi:hypothetical protein IFM89_004043 [Coptis chinensis]|uniref:Uncharacterized protein n=1 Tax=Coptis chinensis TaxID=261450 RepID=A0A835GU31_9MAGN|nr:hypothetical protein IFM89_004043 [Coptis chinensis]